MQDLFEGKTHVYLEGKGALLPIEVAENSITYFIGSEITQLQVMDFRHDPVQAVQRFLEGETDINFAEIFNQSADVVIKTKDNVTLEIELHENSHRGDFPTLWLGVIRDGKMPAHDLYWEILRPVSEEVTAFAALVNL